MERPLAVAEAAVTRQELIEGAQVEFGITHRRAARVVERMLADGAAKQIGPDQFVVADVASVSLETLAAQLNMSASETIRALSELEAAGLVRQISPGVFLVYSA